MQHLKVPNNIWTGGLVCWLSGTLLQFSTAIDFPHKLQWLALKSGRSSCIHVLKMSWDCKSSEKNLSRTLCSYLLVSQCVRGGIKAHMPHNTYIIRCFWDAQMSLPCHCEPFWFAKLSVGLGVGGGELMTESWSLVSETFHINNACRCRVCLIKRPALCSLPGGKVVHHESNAHHALGWFLLHPWIK